MSSDEESNEGNHGNCTPPPPYTCMCVNAPINFLTLHFVISKDKPSDDVKTVRGVCVREQEHMTLFLQTGAVYYVSLPFKVKKRGVPFQ